MKPFIHINEVGPRDGLQNELQTIPTANKIKFIDTLSDSGLKYIEATSFVSPKWVPQLADHREVYLGINKHADIRYPVLVPNRKGMEAAIDCEVKDIAVFTAASQEFSQKNTNRSIAESLERIAEVIALAAEREINVRGYISCVIACPYAGPSDPALVAEISHQLLEQGCYEISLGDTIGVGTPTDVKALLDCVLADIDPAMIAMHFHDTHHHALDNIKLSLEQGITSFDSSVGGLGGCPYAEGASGNVATEAVVNLLQKLGYKTGIDTQTLTKALALL